MSRGLHRRDWRKSKLKRIVLGKQYHKKLTRLLRRIR